MSVTKITIRGFMSTRQQNNGGMIGVSAYFDENAVEEIEVDAGSHLIVNNEGSVRIGYDARNIQEDPKQPAVFRYSREVTYPAWRVVKVETEHDEQT